MRIDTFRLLPLLLPLVFVQACVQSSVPGSAASAAPSAPPDPLVFDTWGLSPCSPNGQAQGQCPPGDRFRDVDARARIGVLEVVDELRQILD